MVENKRVLMIQYAGDYREAVNRFERGGSETYYAQKYSVDTVGEIAQKVEEMAVLVCRTDEPYNEILSNKVRGIGAGFGSDFSIERLIQIIENQKPTHLIVSVPIRKLLQWAIRNKVSTLALLADSFQTKSLRDKIKNYLLARLLNHPTIEWVGNHNINSSKSLQKIGVNPNKIIPWDWKHSVTPDSFSPKQLRQNTDSFTLLFVGAVIETKGIGDVLEAIPKLNSKGLPVVLKIAGKGEVDYYQNRAKELGVADQIEFLGLVPNNKIVHLMREADLVVIPSRPEYSEGLPMTIYEALCSYTPIVASDHPMFQGRLIDGVNSLVFSAGDPSALAERIAKLLSNPDLYEQLSGNSKAAWEKLQIPVKSADLLNRWIFDSPENRQWLYSYRLASGQYN